MIEILNCTINENISYRLWNFLSMNCPVYEMSCLWIVYENFVSMNCPSMNCLVYEMSCLWIVLSMNCPVYELSVYELSVYEMSVYEMSQRQGSSSLRHLALFLLPADWKNRGGAEIRPPLGWIGLIYKIQSRILDFSFNPIHLGGGRISTPPRFFQSAGNKNRARCLKLGYFSFNDQIHVVLNFFFQIYNYQSSLIFSKFEKFQTLSSEFETSSSIFVACRLKKPRVEEEILPPPSGE